MKHILGITLCFLLCGAFPAAAEEAVPSNVVSTEEAQGAPAGLAADQAKIAEERAQRKASMQAAHAEEKALHQQIRDARAAGDTAKVEALRAQLKTTHQGNVAQMRQDKKEMGAAQKEMRADKREARQARADRNQDGTVDSVEKGQAQKARVDRNKDGKVDKVEKNQAQKRGWWGRNKNR